MSTLKSNAVAQMRVQAHKAKIGDTPMERERLALQRRVRLLKDELLTRVPKVFSNGVAACDCWR
jgi:hypothetical protein